MRGMKAVMSSIHTISFVWLPWLLCCPASRPCLSGAAQPSPVQPSPALSGGCCGSDSGTSPPEPLHPSSAPSHGRQRGGSIAAERRGENKMRIRPRSSVLAATERKRGRGREEVEKQRVPSGCASSHRSSNTATPLHTPHSSSAKKTHPPHHRHPHACVCVCVCLSWERLLAQANTHGSVC